jgi:hypothetical protein
MNKPTLSLLALLVGLGLTNASGTEKLPVGTLPLCSLNLDVDSWTNCRGTLKANGEEYVGEFKNGKYHGQGELITSSRNKYTGEFRNGKFNGRGTITYQSGGTYVGNFVDGSSEGGNYQGVTEKNSFSEVLSSADRTSIVILILVIVALVAFALRSATNVHSRVGNATQTAARETRKWRLSSDTKVTISIAVSVAALLLSVGVGLHWHFGTSSEKHSRTRQSAGPDLGYSLSTDSQQPTDRARVASEPQNELEFYFLGTERKLTDRNPYYGIEHYTTTTRWQLTNVSNRTVTIRGFKVNRRTDCTLSVERTLRPSETFAWFSGNDNCGALVRIDVETDRTNESWTMGQ